uniref:Uncharacterized protein n=1 Tax=Arundo donax TaxID=35708 RepID=A0A0A9GI55_ARUDO
MFQCDIFFSQISCSILEQRIKSSVSERQFPASYTLTWK